MLGVASHTLAIIFPCAVGAETKSMADQMIIQVRDSKQNFIPRRRFKLIFSRQVQALTWGATGLDLLVLTKATFPKKEEST
jgi:hypothetical protein